MIKFLDFTFLRKNLGHNGLKNGVLPMQFFKTHLHLPTAGRMFLIALFVPILSSAQNSQLNYKVRFKGNEIGWLKLEKNIAEGKISMSLISEIKTRVIFPVTVFSKELSTFENGRLTYSSQLRKTNGSTKLDKQTKLVGNVYEVFEDGDMEKLSFPFISHNLLSLYFQEPVNLKTVYCDKLQSYVNITKTTDGGYEMKFSNGNSNCFYYKEGVCTKVRIEHLFYTAEIIFVH